ncbi:MAG: 3-hydroxy acid dehydrogenase/malonic semialdehyde reductase [Candidatus Krumholzibacteriia bacterium]|jgi:3-hydroxy acid dehydrogenase/malonic semialdehyde reductase
MLNLRTVLITGASAGIGAACARAFAAAGARLILVARREEKLRALADTLDTECHLVSVDVRDRQSVDNAVASLPNEWSEIDILINNAGLSRGLDKMQDAKHLDWEEMIDTNIKGLLWFSRAVLPGMVARDSGQIINLGSVAGRQVYPGGGVYCATKAAVRALTQSLRIDLLGTRVKASSVDPGLVETEFSSVRFRGDEERAGKTYVNFPPLQADDVAEAVLFCATRPAHVNIQEILIMPQDQAAVYASHPRGIDPEN